MAKITIKRVYEPVEKSDGYRVLIDRLWPRGLAKASSHIDEWMKKIGPSNELRKWFNHDVEKWQAFRRSYKKELKGSDVVEEIIKLMEKHKHVTLLYGAKDEEHNQAVVLQEYLKSLTQKKK